MLKERPQRFARNIGTGIYGWESLSDNIADKRAGFREVTAGNSDIVKLNTQAEKETDLLEYGACRPLRFKKKTDEKISSK